MKILLTAPQFECFHLFHLLLDNITVWHHLLHRFIVFVTYQMYYDYPPPTYLEYPILIAQGEWSKGGHCYSVWNMVNVQHVALFSPLRALKTLNTVSHVPSFTHTFTQIVATHIYSRYSIWFLSMCLAQGHFSMWTEGEGITCSTSWATATKYL